VFGAIAGDAMGAALAGTAEWRDPDAASLERPKRARARRSDARRPISTRSAKASTP
jgi:hypothetical protein